MILAHAKYIFSVGSKFPITPKFCPFCEHESIQPVTRQGVLNFSRCGHGHFFVFDPAPEEKQDQSATEKPNDR
jgi:hypothetical protein